VKSIRLRIVAAAALATALVAGAPAVQAAGGKKNKGAARGAVASVDTAAKSFVVRNKKTGEVTVTTDDKTAFKKDDGSPGAFSDVVVKRRVVVQGGPVTNGKVAATEVDVQPKKAKKPATTAPPAPAPAPAK